jgi:hypothetical protein
MRSLVPDEDRRLPGDLRHFRAAWHSWPRRREYGWMAAAALLALWLAVFGPLDLEAARVTAEIVEEEGARRAPADGSPPDLFAGDPRELHRMVWVFPLACRAPAAQWIHGWGDGRMPHEAHPVTGQRPWVCVNADLRRSGRHAK